MTFNKKTLFSPKPTLEKLKSNKCIKNACSALTFCYESVESFHNLYNQRRKGKKGTSEHKDQDLLRAMLIFSCAGLDTIIKQLINDSLSTIIQLDEGAFKEFEKFVERKLKKNDTSDDPHEQKFKLDYKFLTTALISTNPQKKLISMLCKDRTNNSLQSKDELLKAATVFAISAEEIIEDENTTKKAFDIRNEITHQMDVDFTMRSSYKNRKQRTESLMLAYTNNMLQIALKFIQSVNKKLNQT